MCFRPASPAGISEDTQQPVAAADSANEVSKIYIEAIVLPGLRPRAAYQRRRECTAGDPGQLSVMGHPGGQKRKVNIE